MRNGSILIRDTDSRKFHVTFLSHWSAIEAENGEQDTVKWMGGDDYIASSSGHKFKLTEEVKELTDD